MGIENSRLRNHSGRNAMVQRLSESDVLPTHIAQLSGHKNLKSIQNYSSVSTNQQMPMLLSGLAAGNSSSSSTKAAACSSSLSAQNQGMDRFSAASSHPRWQFLHKHQHSQPVTNAFSKFSSEANLEATETSGQRL